MRRSSLAEDCPQQKVHASHWTMFSIPLLLLFPAMAASAVAADHWGFDLAGRDLSVRPQDDFFDYANGTYLAKLEIPADRPRTGAPDRLIDFTLQRIKNLLETAAAKPRDPLEAKMGAFYQSFMDEAALERADISPIAKDLADIAAANDAGDIARLMGRLGHGFVTSPIALSIEEDDAQTRRHALYIGQGDLGLPDRDFYLADRFAKPRQLYTAYAGRMLTLAGWRGQPADAAAIVAFETELARKAWSRADRRDPTRTYHPGTLQELQSQSKFDWAGFLAGAGLDRQNRFVLREDSAVKAFADLVASTPLPTLKAWLTFKAADGAAPYLSSRFSRAHYEFWDAGLGGQSEPQARWRLAADAANTEMRNILGQLYARAYLKRADKLAAEAMVANLRLAMADGIRGAQWMSPSARSEALAKLAAMRIDVGAPARWRDDKALRIDPTDLAGNIRRSREHEWAESIRDLHRPVDRARWALSPATVNASYNGSTNAIAIPAAVLQPPLFDSSADPAVNYGGLGGVIAHEITHAFDDRGRRRDRDGLLRNWWTPSDEEKFKAEAGKLGAQYAAAEPAPGLRINAAQTMGENIADLGAVKIAVAAYRRSLGGRTAPVRDGLTGEQRVFHGWAQLYRVKYRPEMVPRQLASDVHSPPRYRVNIPLANVDDFAAAYKLAPTDKMYRPASERARIW